MFWIVPWTFAGIYNFGQLFKATSIGNGLFSIMWLAGWAFGEFLTLRVIGWNLFGKDESPPDEPADRLYNEGLFLLNQKKDPKEAVKKFEEVDRQHPYSEWARKSLIMSSFAYFQQDHGI